MKGVILAAGKGSRLYPITHHIPKPLLPLGNRVTLEYAFDRLKEINVHEICLVVGENEPRMKEALGDGHQFGVKLTYVRQPEPKGLAHAVGFTKEFCGNDSFVLYLGDAIYSDGFAQFRHQFESAGCANLNLVKPVEDPRRFGVANVSGDRITKLVEKPANPESNLAMAGLYFFSSALWQVLPDLQPSARGEYEITDAIQLLIDRGFDVRAGIYEHLWFDTGTLDSFLDTSRYLAGEELLDGGSTLSGAHGRHVVLGAGADVECEAIEDSVVMPGAVVRCKGKISRAILAGKVSAEGDISREIRFGDELIRYE
ncbi:MAG: NTP transferase domain-containing protein [Armatimonadetes bacterium]|nr:NTP transferase domain-containing protein [Armatimonadota bacterium]